MKPFISVIIPTYNRPDLVKKVIRKVVEQTDNSFEIVVVDNGDVAPLEMATEELEGMVRVKLLRSRPGSTSRAKNEGISASEGEWCVFLDDDCFPCEGYGSILKKRLSTMGSGSYLLGRVLPLWIENPPVLILESNTALDYLSVFDPKVDSGEGVITSGLNAAMAIKKDDLKFAGNFREDLGRQGYTFLISNEESDLQVNLQKRGVMPYFDQDFLVRHVMEPERVQLSWLRKRAFWQGVSDSLTIATDLEQGVKKPWALTSLDELSIKNLPQLFDYPSSGFELNEVLKTFRLLGNLVSDSSQSENNEESLRKISFAQYLAQTVVTSSIVVEFYDTHPQNASLFARLNENLQAILIPKTAWDWRSNTAKFVLEFLTYLPSFVRNVVFSSLDPLLLQESVEFKPAIANSNISYFGIIHSGNPELVKKLKESRSQFLCLLTHSETGAEALRSQGILNAHSLGFFNTSELGKKPRTLKKRFSIGMFGEFRLEKKYSHTIATLEEFAKNFKSSVNDIEILMYGVNRDQTVERISNQLIRLGYQVTDRTQQSSSGTSQTISDLEFFSTFQSIECMSCPYGPDSSIYVSGPVMQSIFLGQYILHDPSSKVGIEILKKYSNHSITNAEELRKAVTKFMTVDNLECKHSDMNDRLAEKMSTILGSENR